MYFLNYKEVDLNFVYSSSLRNILIKKNIVNNNILKLPKIELYFVFNKVTDIDLKKIARHFILLWLLTGKKSNIKKIKVRLSRGIKYYSFVISNFINIDLIKFILIDFIVNTVFFLVNNQDLKKYNNIYESFLVFTNLDQFANLRFSRSFYTAKVDDPLYLRFKLKKGQSNLFSIDDFLYLLKVKNNE